MNEFNTPAPVTLMEKARFVFYFVPQKVAENLDNVPQFYVDIVEKANTDNLQRLYITFKPMPDLYFLDQDSLQAGTKAIALQLRAYLKKHFGSKFSLVESLVEKNVQLPVSLEEALETLTQRTVLRADEELTDYFTVSRALLGNSSNLTRVSPALLQAYVFNFWDNLPTEEQTSSYVVLTGQALLFGEPMFFQMDDVSDFNLDKEVLMQFISPQLIEDTLNHSLHISHATHTNFNHPYVMDVEFIEV